MEFFIQDGNGMENIEDGITLKMEMEPIVILASNNERKINNITFHCDFFEKHWKWNLFMMERKTMEMKKIPFTVMNVTYSIKIRN